MKRSLFRVLAVASVFAFTVEARAHGFLDHAVPAVGSSVRTAPKEVKLWFSQTLEPAFCAIKVVDGNGRNVDAGDPSVDPKDRTVLRITLKPLPPGTYKVVWRVLSVDTHVTTGDFTFVVAP